jgi:hypothetical protein
MFNLKKDFYTLLLWSASALFVALYAILSYNNRLAADDLYYLANYPKVGVWGCMEYLYQTYSARWSAYLFTGAVVSLSQLKWTLFIFHTFTLASLVATLSLILHQILNLRLHSALKKQEILLYTTITVAGLFFTSYSIGETWFWVVQVCTYLWCIIMSLVLIYAFLNNCSTGFNLLLIVIAGLFIGGSSESYALVNLFLLGGYLFFGNIRFSRLPFLHFTTSKNMNLKLAIALIAVLIGFAITMAAPGNGVRYNALPHPSYAMLLWIQMKSFIKIVFIRTPLNLPILLLFGAPWFLLGNRMQKKNSVVSFSQFLKSALPYLFIVLTLIFIFLVPTSLVMAELGPDRALSFVSFFIALSFSTGLFWAGMRLSVDKRAIHLLKIGIPASMIILLTYQTTNQRQITAAYARSYDSRNIQLKTLKQKNEDSIIVLDSLKPSGMLYSAEISTNPNHFSNQFLKASIGLNRDVQVRSKQ